MAAWQQETKPRLPMALLVVAIGVAMGATAAAVARQGALFGPRIGDIVRFDPDHTGPDTGGLTVIAARPDGSTCAIDLDLLRRNGGSMVLERVEPNRARPWGAHWAGSRTTEDARDCGSSADLTISQIDVTILASAAGGYGIDHTPLAVGQ